MAQHSIAGDTALKAGRGNPSVPRVAALRHCLAARKLSLQLAGALPISQDFRSSAASALGSLSAQLSPLHYSSFSSVSALCYLLPSQHF